MEVRLSSCRFGVAKLGRTLVEGLRQDTTNITRWRESLDGVCLQHVDQPCQTIIITGNVTATIHPIQVQQAESLLTVDRLVEC